jgi:hypothetical protein
MGLIKSNERELSGKIAQWFTEEIARGGYPFKSASNEPGIEIENSTTYFGDIVIWESDESRIAYTLIELKNPFSKIENLERFRKKAVGLKVKLAYTWNFQQLQAYKVENNKLIIQDTDSCSILTNIDDWLRGDVQVQIKVYIRKICEELLTISQVGRFTKFKPDKFYFVHFLRGIVNKLIPVYELFIKDEHRKKENRDVINKYVIEQGISYPSDDEFYYLIACQSVYGFVTKIIFYLTIRRYFKDLPEIQNEDYTLGDSLNLAFAAARDKDWQAVFVDGPIDQLGLPNSATPIIEELLADLKIYNFGDLPEDVIGELFEDLIEPKHRHSLGKYFTKEDLVDFIIGTIVNDYSKVYADPTCGSGTFLIRLYSRLKYLRPHLKHEEILSRIWGIDIGKFPAELSTINLFRQNSSNFENFPRVIHEDIFHLFPGQEFEFPPPTSGQKYLKVKIPLPSFAGLVGNFPFIRQELIEKKVKGYKNFLTKVLAQDYLFSYPDLFIIKNRQIRLSTEEIKDKSKPEVLKFIENAVDKKHIELKLSGQADIYTYIFLHSACLLEPDGSMAIITSNSWLDVSYGSILKQFLLDHFKIKMIVASWAEPWFEDAAVNTIFTVVEKCPNKEERDKNNVRFVKVKRTLAEMIPFPDLQLESLKRWQKIDGLVRVIETSDSSAKPVTEQIKGFENDDFRIRLVSQKFLTSEITKDPDLAKWGKYLRAPDVYFELIEKLKDKLVPLKTLADVRFGIKTGINDFFYLTPVKGETETYRNSRNWQGKIEPEYLRKVIKSPKESDSIRIDPEKLKNVLFVCTKSKEELRKEGHYLALGYIDWGEKQKTSENISWPEVSSVKARNQWWSLSNVNEPDLILSCGIRNSYKFFSNENSKCLIDKRLYEVYTENEFVLPLLNSSIIQIQIESDTRVLGDGFIDLTVYEVENLLIPKNEYLNKKVIKAFRSLESRKIKDIQSEYKSEDRKKFDKEIYDSIGLDTNKTLPMVYQGIRTIVEERLNQQKIRTKKQKQRIEFSFEDVKRSVISECIGSQPKKFPESFYTPTKIGQFYENLEFETINTRGTSVKSEYFLGNYTLTDSDKQVIYETDSPVKVSFIKKLAVTGVFQIRVPKDTTVLSSIIENYQNYSASLKEILLTNANQKLHNWNEAEKMVSEILIEYNFEEI